MTGADAPTGRREDVAPTEQPKFDAPPGTKSDAVAGTKSDVPPSEDRPDDAKPTERDAQVLDVPMEYVPMDSGSKDTVAGEVSTPAPSLWESRGIGGGGAFFGPEISPVDDQIYMATDMGAVFRSTSFGASWSTVDFRKLTGGKQARVRFTSDPRILYAIAPAGEVYVPYISKDQGATFTQLTDASATELYSIEVDPNRADRLLVSNWSGLFLSTNSGATFRQVYTGADNDAGLLLAGAFWDETTIYVGTNDGVLLSTNGGTSFALQTIGGIAAGENIVSFAGAKQGTTTRFFAVTSTDAFAGMYGCDATGAGVYRLDAGQTAWTKVSGKLPSGQLPAFVGMAATNTSVAYLGGKDSGGGAPTVAKTTDGGDTWSNVFRTANNDNIATGWSGAGGDKDWSYGECTEGFAVSRANADRVVITDLGYVHVSSDGGASWRQAYVNPADQNPAGAPTPKARAYRGIGAEDTSVWWLTWPDATTIVASFTDMIGLRSTDSGLHWVRDGRNGLTFNTTYQAIIGGASGTLYAATSPMHDLYMSYRLQDAQLDVSGGTVMQSTDKGARWTLVHDFNHPVIFLALDPSNADTMYASVVHHTAGGIFRTTNLSSGTSSSWTQLPSPPRTEGHPYNIVVLKDGSVVATYSGRRTTTFTDSSGVFVLAPGATSWTDVSVPGMHYWVKDLVVDPNDAKQNTWYVGVFQAWGVSAAQNTNGLYRTMNRGQSWERIFANHNVESATVDPANPARMFVTTDADGLWVTTNLTATTPTFTADPDYPFMHPMRVFFNPYVAGETWVASFGGGLRVRRF